MTIRRIITLFLIFSSTIIKITTQQNQTIVEINFDVDDLEDLKGEVLILIAGQTSLKLFDFAEYTINSETFIVTDVTSINTPNCSFPFEYENQTNSFCAKKEENNFICLTDSEDEEIECDLGKFLSISDSKYMSQFTLQQSFGFNRNAFYEMSFFYLIDDLNCEKINFKISVKPVDYDIYIDVFDSKRDSVNLSYSSWNEINLCFYVETGIYEVHFIGSNNCSQLRPILFDNFRINEQKYSSHLDESSCINLRNETMFTTNLEVSSSTTPNEISLQTTSEDELETVTYTDEPATTSLEMVISTDEPYTTSLETVISTDEPDTTSLETVISTDEPDTTSLETSSSTNPSETTTSDVNTLESSSTIEIEETSQPTLVTQASTNDFTKDDLTTPTELTQGSTTSSKLTSKMTSSTTTTPLKSSDKTTPIDSTLLIVLISVGSVLGVGVIVVGLYLLLKPKNPVVFPKNTTHSENTNYETSYI